MRVRLQSAANVAAVYELMLYELVGQRSDERSPTVRSADELAEVLQAAHVHPRQAGCLSLAEDWATSQSERPDVQSHHLFNRDAFEQTYCVRCGAVICTACDNATTDPFGKGWVTRRKEVQPYYVGAAVRRTASMWLCRRCVYGE